MKTAMRHIPKILTALFIALSSSDTAVMASSEDTARKDTLHLYQKFMGDTIRFAGYDWSVKDSHGERTGPGTNLFSSSKKNVWVDTQGRLHLKVTEDDEDWYCPEVAMVRTLGYGKYTFQLEALPQVLDQDIVMGFFLYDHLDAANHHSEMDIEISVWGQPGNQNAQYVVQPMEDHAYRFDIALGRRTAHSMEITKKKATFTSWYPANESMSDPKDTKISEHRFKLAAPYFPDNEKVCMNVWLFKAIEPHNLKEFELVVKDFTFEPF